MNFNATMSAQMVKGFRKGMGITQEDLAHMVGVTVSTVNRWETGRAKPSRLAWTTLAGMAHERGRSDFPEYSPDMFKPIDGLDGQEAVA